MNRSDTDLEEIRRYQEVALRMAEVDKKTGIPAYEWWYRMYQMFKIMEVM